MRTAPSIVSVKIVRPDVIKVFVACEQDGTLTAYALVKATRLELGAARPVVADDHTVRLMSIQVFELSPDCAPGDIIWLNNQYHILVSINGSPVVSVQDDQLKALRQKIRARAEEKQALIDERDKPRQEQEINLRMAAIRQEATLEKERLAKAEQLKVYQQEREQQEILRKQAEGVRKQAEEAQNQEIEKLRRERHFATELALRGKRLCLDALRLERYPELMRHTRQLTIEQEIQAMLTVPGLQYTPLLAIELNQAIEHEQQNLSAFREEAKFLEDLAKEQGLQETQRLQQEQVIRQEEEAKQKQQDIDERAARYEKTGEPIVYHKALVQLDVLRRFVEEGAKSRIIQERADNLRSRCMKSREAVPSESVQTPTPDGQGAKVGAVVGGIFGMIGGPIGMAIGAALGGFIGNVADHAGDSAVTSQVSPEREQWTTLLQGIDGLLSKLSEQRSHQHDGGA